MRDYPITPDEELVKLSLWNRDLKGVGAPQGVALALLIALFGASLERCLASQFAVLGDMRGRGFQGTDLK